MKFEKVFKGWTDQFLSSLFLTFRDTWVTGQNGSGQNGTDKMVWTKWYTDKMVLNKMARTKWYGQNGTILYFVYPLIQLNSIYI